eukprot:g28038.t1
MSGPVHLDDELVLTQADVLAKTACIFLVVVWHPSASSTLDTLLCSLELRLARSSSLTCKRQPDWRVVQGP